MVTADSCQSHMFGDHLARRWSSEGLLANSDFFQSLDLSLLKSSALRMLSGATAFMHTLKQHIKWIHNGDVVNTCIFRI
jgi:hypothetical protein